MLEAASTPAQKSKTGTSYGGKTPPWELLWTNAETHLGVSLDLLGKSTRTSAIPFSCAFDSSMYVNNHALHLWSVFESQPSIMYENSVHSLPENPMRRTPPFNVCRVYVIAS